MRTLAALAGLAVLSACALFAPKFETPRLDVVGMELERGDLFAQHLKVRMRVQNPNDRALPVKSLAYTLEVEGQELARGESVAGFTVPALGEAEFDMHVTTNMAGALVQLLGHSGAEMPYRLAGKVTLSEGMLRSIPFDEHGSFKLR
jgi:LEA14-like dessication related protein